MINEPLKDKLVSKVKKGTGGYAGKAKRAWYAEKEDIKSAVEWLKQEISTLPEDVSVKHFKNQLWFIIPEAFPDIRDNQQSRKNDS